MHKLNVVVIAALFAGAAVLGTVAALRTTSIGAAGRSGRDAAVVAQTRRLDRFEAALQGQLAKRPPALPPIPARPAQATAPAPRVVYRRPPAIVVVRHLAHHDDGGAEAQGGGGDD